jgi:hypothetical protein
LLYENGENHPDGVAVDGSHLYWADDFSGSGEFGAGTINDADLNGNGPHVIVTGQLGPSAGVAVDASHLYWSAAALHVSGFGSVWQANLDGSNPQAIVTSLNGSISPVAVAIGP